MIKDYTEKQSNRTKKSKNISGSCKMAKSCHKRYDQYDIFNKCLKNYSNNNGSPVSSVGRASDF